MAVDTKDKVIIDREHSEICDRLIDFQDAAYQRGFDRGSNKEDLVLALDKAENYLIKRKEQGVGISKLSHRVEGFIDGLKFALGQKSDFLGTIEDQRASLINSVKEKAAHKVQESQGIIGNQHYE